MGFCFGTMVRVREQNAKEDEIPRRPAAGNGNWIAQNET